MLKKLKQYLIRDSSPEVVIKKLANKSDSLVVSEGFDPNTFDFTAIRGGEETHGKIITAKGKWQLRKIK